MRAARRRAAAADASRPNPMPPDTAPEDLAWARRGASRSRSRRSREAQASAEPSAPRTYIYAKRAGTDDNFREFLERAQA